MKSVKLLILAVVIMLVSMGSARYVAPTAPMPKSPQYGSVITNYKPTLIWSPAIPAPGTTIAGYTIQIAPSSTFSYGLNSFSVSASKTSFTLPVSTVVPARLYYWRVGAKNNLGEWAWSPTTRFYTAVKKPINLSPSDGSDPTTTPNLLRLRPRFQWDKVTSAQGYNIQISADCGFLIQIVNVTITTNSFTPGIDLPADTFMCWRVRATHSTYGPSAWSAIQGFTTPNPPSIPVPQAPNDDTLTNDNSPRLDWSTVSIPAGTTFDKYQVEIANTQNFRNYTYRRLVDITTGVEDSEYNIPDENDLVPDMLPGGRTYYWRARSYNSNGEYSTWSKVFILNITVDRPINLSVTPNPPTDPRPLFDWSNIYQADRYRIFISTNPLFVGDDLIVRTSKVSQYRPTFDLPRSVTLYWRVQAVDVNSKYGESLYSETASFLSSNAPTSPILGQPGNKAKIADTTPRLVWGPVTLEPGTTFDHYEIRLAENAKFTIGLKTWNRAGTSITIGTPLAAGGRMYYWSVRACNTDGHCSAWAPTFTFTIN